MECKIVISDDTRPLSISLFACFNKKSFETEYYFLFLKDEATWESIKLAKDPIKKPRNTGPVL